MEFKHKSVLLDETVGGLNIKPDGIYVDGTLGGAGHAIEVCRKLSAKGRFIGIDQDQDAIIAASERLAAFDQVTTGARRKGSSQGRWYCAGSGSILISAGQ